MGTTISQKAERRITCYLLSMLIVHCALLVQESSRIRTGYPDFSIFYTAAKILQQGRASEIYRDSLQETVQRSFSPAVDERGTILPFNHPPFEALVFWPVAHLSYTHGYYAWLALNGVIVMVSVFMLFRQLPALSATPPWLWLLAGFGFPPVAIALILGQDVTWVLLCYCMAFAALRRNAEVSAGVWLGLGLCKFHLILPFLIAPMLQRRWRLLGGFAATAAGLLLVTWVAFGSAVLWQYPSYVWWADHVSKFPWNALHRNVPNLRGMVLTLLPEHWGVAGQSVVVLLSLALMIVAIRMWFRAGDDLDQRALAFSANLVTTVLLSYHTGVQDLSLLLLPTLVLLDYSLRRWSAKRGGIWFLTGLMFCTPLYLVLVLRYGRVALLAWMTLALLFVISIALDSARGPSSERLSAQTQ